MEFSVKPRYKKSYKKLPHSLQRKVDERLILFSKNPFNAILRNHWLRWPREGYRSVNISWDYRLIFQELSDGTYELIELVDVWSHSQLYG